MKKAYVKPEVKEIKMAANQAIAACSGWANSWSYNANGDVTLKLPNGAYKCFSTADRARSGSNGYNTIDPTSQNVDAYPVYQYQDGPNNYGLWLDKDGDGSYDSDENGGYGSGAVPTDLTAGSQYITVS